MENDNKLIMDYQEIAEYWDENSLADHWVETEAVEFEISPNARHRYLTVIDLPIIQQSTKSSKDSCTDH